MDLKVSMVILSHLSDMELELSDELLCKCRMHFIKLLLRKYPDTSVSVPEHDIDAMWTITREYIYSSL